MPKVTTSQVWNKAVQDMEEAMSKLLDIQSEIQEKLDQLTEEEQDSPRGLTYQEIANLELEELDTAISDIKGVVVDSMID